MSDHADTLRGTLTLRIDEIRAEYWDARERLGEAACLDQVALAMARAESERDALAARRDALENALRGYLTEHENGLLIEGEQIICMCGYCIAARDALAATDTTRDCPSCGHDFPAHVQGHGTCVECGCVAWGTPTEADIERGQVVADYLEAGLIPPPPGERQET